MGGLKMGEGGSQPEDDDEHAYAVEGPALLPELGYEVFVEVGHAGNREGLEALLEKINDEISMSSLSLTGFVC